MSSTHYYAVIRTRIGWMAALGTGRGIRRIQLPRATPEEAIEGLGPEVSYAELAPEQFAGLRQQVEEYLDGHRTTFDLKLDMDGYSPFFSRAWQACASIPPGETRSYRWLAAQAGNAAAVRAAGQAMARNPIPLIIPCHRVVGSDGGLHGYGGGLDMKQHLLELERRHKP